MCVLATIHFCVGQVLNSHSFLLISCYSLITPIDAAAMNATLLDDASRTPGQIKSLQSAFNAVRSKYCGKRFAFSSNMRLSGFAARSNSTGIHNSHSIEICMNDPRLHPFVALWLFFASNCCFQWTHVSFALTSKNSRIHMFLILQASVTAKSVRSTPRRQLSSPRVVQGTPDYIAPELLLGRPHGTI